MNLKTPTTRDEEELESQSSLDELNPPDDTIEDSDDLTLQDVEEEEKEKEAE